MKIRNVLNLRLTLKISFYSLFFMLISSCESKPEPQRGKVVFNVPSLVNKNIDEIMKIFNKSLDSYQDTSQDNKDRIYLKDMDSEISEGFLKDNKGDFSFKRKGWTLGVEYDITTRETIYIYIVSDFANYESICFHDVRELLLIGNLDRDSPDYDLTFNDCFISEFTLNDTNRPSEFKGVSVYPKNNNLESE